MFSATSASAQSEIVRIEEDWELVVANPDALLDAPQVTVTMVPFLQKPNLHLQVNLNYALKPDFASGGIQVRIQNEDSTLAHVHRKAGIQLSNPSEVVQWTTAIQKTESGYGYGIQTGNGTSWGEFGGPNYFLSLNHSTTSAGLEGYTPVSSLENSGATYAGNRVTSLYLKRFRVYANSGLLAEHQVNALVQ